MIGDSTFVTPGTSRRSLLLLRHRNAQEDWQAFSSTCDVPSSFSTAVNWKLEKDLTLNCKKSRVYFQICDHGWMLDYHHNEQPCVHSTPRLAICPKSSSDFHLSSFVLLFDRQFHTHTHKHTHTHTHTHTRYLSAPCSERDLKMIAGDRDCFFELCSVASNLWHTGKNWKIWKDAEIWLLDVLWVKVCLCKQNKEGFKSMSNTF